jgi:hypothetical protein
VSLRAAGGRWGARPAAGAGSAGALDHYAWAVRKHLVRGKHRLAKLTPDHVDELLERRIESGLAKNTVARIRACW